MRDLDRYIDEVQEEVRLVAETVAETRFAEQRIEAELDSRVASDLSPFVHDREILIAGREQLQARDAALDDLPTDLVNA